eukprot:CAMPEP_0185270216 /NCGR_PEP_ID=MMETSP1359-20130426/41754_1 /TAXON_ID=552665 /ORGANISM="Bigelowiella longifila, Strain CCMP242" /LENGTH=70 /DNA_ID=CAMNT_0027861687 /DNA_START=614 /DNA_END=826 /DNA_ORIENTATION=+
MTPVLRGVTARELRDAAPIRDHYGKFHGHRLEHRQAPSFSMAREHEGAHLAKELRQELRVNHGVHEEDAW